MQFRLAAVLLLFLFLPACDSGDGGKVVEGQPARPFALPDLTGNRVNLEELKGYPVVVRFWSDWCAFCKGEMTDIQEIWEELKPTGLRILAVNVGQDRQTALDFVTSLGVTYDCLLDAQSDVARAYGVTGLPTTFFIDRAGIVRGRIIGEATPEVFAAKVRDLL